MNLSFLFEVGPVNGLIILATLAGGLAVAGLTTARLRSGDDVALAPIVIALAAPLLFAIYAGTWQYTAALESVAQASGPVKQTLLAMAVSKAVATQIAAGIAAVIPAFAIIIGCLSVASFGERPRSGIAAVAAILTILLTASALGSGAASGAWGLAAIRALLYLAAGIGTTAALLTTHHRGPGAQVGPVAAATLPLLVAALDASGSGWLSVQELRMIAVAAPSDKQGMMLATGEAITILRGFSGLSVMLALSLAALGPVASAYKSRPLVARQTVAIAASMASALAVVLLTSAYLAPFTALP